MFHVQEVMQAKVVAEIGYSTCLGMESQAYEKKMEDCSLVHLEYGG